MLQANAKLTELSQARYSLLTQPLWFPELGLRDLAVPGQMAACLEIDCLTESLILLHTNYISLLGPLSVLTPFLTHRMYN